jgi:probable phosphoglycerate mutase
MTRITLVRHGETEWNATKRVQGSSDIPLNDTGREQAQEAALALAGESWDAVLASPLSRARETAEIIAAGLGLGEITPIPQIAERSYGAAEGMRDVDIRANFPAGLESVPDLESRQAVVARALPALLALAESHPDQSLIVVSHGAVIGSIVRELSGGTLPAAGQQITNASAHRFQIIDGDLVLLEFAGVAVPQPETGRNARI